jgi:hypothetical protein
MPLASFPPSMDVEILARVLRSAQQHLASASPTIYNGITRMTLAFAPDRIEMRPIAEL